MMEFELAEDQRLIKDSIRRLIVDRYDFASRQRYQGEADGWSAAIWHDYASLGLLGLPFDERYGGLSCGATEIMLVMEAIGGALALEPYFATVVLAGGILRHGASNDQCRSLVPEIVSGHLTMSLAHSEPGARYDLARVATTAQHDGNGWILGGTKSLVLQGDSADKLIVSARTGGNASDEHGIGLFLVDAAAAGVSRQGYALHNGCRAATIRFDGVHVIAQDVIGEPGNGFALLSRVGDEAIAALCAEGVGAMAALHELTVDYLKQRRQFGVAIGSFQALQHRAVDMLMALEQARSMALFATMMVSADDPRERAKAMSAAKVQIGRSARMIGEQAIQLHGGIGMTMEYIGGHYLKRLTIIDLMFGDADHHVRALAQAGGLFGTG
jgi:pimeloyl-CoA dehydrogenase small subunit